MTSLRWVTAFWASTKRSSSPRVFPARDRVFDAATGSGRMPRVLVEKGCRIVSGDIELRKIRHVRSRTLFSGLRKIDGLQLDLFRLCFADKTLDNIVCANVFHEVDDPEALIRELLRVFSGRGRIVVLDFTEHGFAVIDKVSRMRHGTGHPVKGVITRDMVRELLDGALLPVCEDMVLPLNWAIVAGREPADP